MPILLVAIGGAIGSVLRYLATLLSTQWFGSSFPYGTLLVNVLGSFILGVVLAAIQSNLLLSTYWRPLITVGLLGGLTTFSTFSYESFIFFSQGELLKAGLNVLLNLGLGLCAVALGYYFVSHT